ncbi:MAG TPA: chloride channel protein [Acidimicrobiales bacterium]|nr:chloride channel protein [Acidimicrobiales bacterium]
MPADPRAVVRSPDYIRLLVLAALIGAPIAAAAWGFLWLVGEAQEWLYTDLPNGLGFDDQPTWWPLPLLALAGILVALTIRYLPGHGGESPAEGFHAGGPPPTPIELPGIFIAALTGLALGAVIGPEAPLIALGAGLGVCAVRLARRDAPETTLTVVAAAGSFAAFSTLVGSPLIAAFILMEAIGLGGPMLGTVLVPGLVAAGIGTLIFVGLDSLTGLGKFSLAIPDLPAAGTPTIAEFGWAIAIGVVAAPVGLGIRKLARSLQPHVERRILMLTPVAGLAIAGLAIAFGQVSDKSSSLVLFSGQDALGPFLDDAASYSIGALVLLLVCKTLAYGVSLSSFRGGPIFPALFVGAVGGVALSHLPGLDPVAGAAMGMGAMVVVMLGLPLSAVLLATLLLGSDGLDVTPLVIIAVAIAYVATERLVPAPAASAAPAAPAPAQEAASARQSPVAG